MSEITDLAKTIKEENEKTRALNEKLANGTRENGQFASQEEIDVAKASLKKQDDQRAMTKKMLGISERRMAEAEDLSNQIQAQEQIMAEQKSALEESGIDADKSAKYQKEQIKLDKLNAKKDDATGAAAIEDEAKAGAKDSKMMGYLKQTAGFLGGIASQGMQKVKSGLGGFMKFAFGALAVAALAFLNSPQFDKYYHQIVNVIVPALAYIYDKIIKPLAIYIGGKLKKAFKDLKEVIDGKKGILEFILENKVVVAGIAAALAPKGMFSVLSKGVGLMSTGIGKAWGSKAVKTFLSGSGGKLLGVGLLVGGLAKATKDGFDGYAKSEEWGVDKFSGTFGAALAGTKKGFKGATEQATKWAAILGGAGLLIFPPIGAVIGGALGLVIGGILGYFGGEKIAKGIDNLLGDLGKGWESVTSFISDAFSSIFDGAKKALGIEVEETPETLARDQRIEEREVVGEAKIALRRNTMKQENLKRTIGFARRDVDNFSEGIFGIGAESDEEQMSDRVKLKTLQKELAALEKEEKKLTNNVVNAPSSVTNANSSSHITNSHSIANPNAALSALSASMGN